MALNTDYVIRETGTNLFRNVGLTVASVITVTIALVLVGVSFLIRDGLDQATRQWEGGIELIIFMDPKIQPAQRDALETKLKGNPEVDRFEYVDKKEAYEDFKDLFRDQQEMIDSVPADALPTSFRVVPVNPEIASITALRNQYEDDAGVFQVVSADETIRRMQKLLGFLSGMCVVIAVAGTIAAVVLIFNTIRMAMFARRREIEVMKLVGASNWFIRIPFMLEGFIQGLLGSLAAVVSIYIFNGLLTDQLSEEGVGLLADFVVPSSHLAPLSFLLVLAGVTVAILCSGVAASRYLDV
jgi:cell division transport system permease protein